MDGTRPADLYELLQVHPKADPQIIQKAYHTLMQRHHPDQGGDPDHAKRINAAYEILMDPDRRRTYDQVRLHMLRRKIAKSKVPTPSPSCPQFSADGVLVADERGHRVLLLTPQGDIKAEIGGSSGQSVRLKSPVFASHLADQHVLVVDHERVMELDEDWQVIWQITTPLKQPVHAERTPDGTTLVTDAATRTVTEFDEQGEPVWNLEGLLNPQSASRLTNGHTLVADTERLLEVSPQGKVSWSIPAQGLKALWKKGDRPFHTANFAQRLDNGHTLVADVEILWELTPSGEVCWCYDQLKEVEIRRAYRLENGHTLVDYAHLVKKGINQEILLLDSQSRPVWRHYYSQHRFI